MHHIQRRLLFFRMGSESAFQLCKESLGISYLHDSFACNNAHNISWVSYTPSHNHYCNGIFQYDRSACICDHKVIVSCICTYKNQFWSRVPLAGYLFRSCSAFSQILNMVGIHPNDKFTRTDVHTMDKFLCMVHYKEEVLPHMSKVV